jgi:hypothetical protein
MSDRWRRDPAGPDRGRSGAGSNAGSDADVEPGVGVGFDTRFNAGFDASFEVAEPNDQELMNVAGRHEDPTDAFPAETLPGDAFPGDGFPAGKVAAGPGPGWQSGSGPPPGSGSSTGLGSPAGAAATLDGMLDGSDVDLGEDPFDDDLSSQLKARTPLKLTSRTTLALSGAVLVVAGFIGGVLVQKNFGTTTPAANNRAGIGALANGAGGTGGAAANGGTGGGAGGAAAGRNATTGTVKFVDGTTIYLTGADGSTITVKTSSTTAVRVLQTGSAKDIPVGATVVVQGSADADGIITATQVTAQK